MLTYGQEYGNRINLQSLSEKQHQEIIKSRRYAKYTYTVSVLNKELVLLTNSILLNEMHDSVTFRNPASLLQSIRGYRRHKSLRRSELLQQGLQDYMRTHKVSEEEAI